MKRRHAHVTGNVLMVLGLVTMVAGVGYAVLNQLPQLNLPSALTNAAIMAIFMGALIWLVGARLSGREKVCDRYYWLRHYGSPRCRHGHAHHPAGKGGHGGH
ncbi:stress-induced protein YchH [Pantoea sp. 1.19]|uniref:stress-induced protein YchH n=1 Tax=Pantoea sp. 1.19 TaxID=1925589 RepID=UPI000948EC0C|nr:stress-induced protein YchH [Pantoea sp. 1.19]